MKKSFLYKPITLILAIVIASVSGLLPARLTGSAAKAADLPLIYCNIATSDGDVTPVGIYSFTPDFDLNLTPVKVDDRIKGVNGAVCTGDKYEVVYMMDHRTFDTDSWECIHEDKLGWPAFMEMAAHSLAYDATDGKVYGCFTTTNQTNRLATVDYATHTQTEIVDLGQGDYPECLFATPQGVLYGILKNGMLVKIDKTTGAFTEIGDLGLKLKGYQGAVCDPVSGKTYWAASAEAGSGVYEIDLTDASTILVAEFPNGEQATGLYIKSKTTPQPPVAEVRIYGNLATSDGDVTPVGIYSFTPDFDLNLTAVKVDDRIKGVNGAVCTGDKYEVVYMMDHRTFDTDSWECIHEDKLGWPAFMEMAAHSLAYDATDGKVYGCFTTTNQTNRLATVDYATHSLTEIVDLGQGDYPECLFATPQGVLYGILKNGMLVKIDKTTGAFAEVGDLGLRLKGYQGAVCDPASGKTYWAAGAEAGSGVYEIDLTDASTVLVAEFPNGEQFTGLYMKASAPAQTELPAAAENIELDFGEPLSGTVSFDIPALSESGNPLSGPVDYTVWFDETEMASGTAVAGSNVVTDVVSLDKSGEYLVKVVLRNAAGKSAAAYKRRYVGYAVPGAATDVRLTIDGGKARLTWQAPATAEGEGVFNAANLRYEIVRYPQQITVAGNLAGTTFSENIDSDELCNYSYGVKVCNGDAGSAEARSNSVRVGSAVSVPYHEDFRRTDALDLYTIEDCNNDGCTWGLNSWSPVLEYYGSSCDNNADDWVITPAVRLFKGKVYRLNISAVGDSRLYMQNFDVAMGGAASASAMTTRLIAETEVTSEGCDRRASFTVDADGLYYFGIHTATEARHGWINITDLLIEETGDVSAPAAPALSVVAGEKGALSARISLTAPTATYEGNALRAIGRIELRRENTVLKTWNNPATGVELSFDDASVPEGLHVYEAVAYSAEGTGYPAEATVYVGIDAPGPVENITLEEKEGKAVLSWTPSAVGAHGGYVDVEKLSYTVQRSDGEIVADNISGTAFTDALPDYGDQYDLAYAVVPRNNKGVGILVVSPKIIVGSDYELPFEESFYAGNTSYYWGLESNNAATFSLTDALGLDGDNGSVLFISSDIDGESSIYTGRVSFEGAENPVLEADLYLGAGNFTMEIDVLVDGRRDHIAAYDIPLDGKISRIRLPLTAYAGMKRVQVWFRGKSSMANTQLALDNINIRDVDDTGIADITAVGATVITAVDGAVTVHGAAGLDVTVCRLDGTVAASRHAAGDSLSIALPAGIYVVRAGACTAKIIVR